MNVKTAKTPKSNGSKERETASGRPGPVGQQWTTSRVLVVADTRGDPRPHILRLTCKPLRDGVVEVLGFDTIPPAWMPEMPPPPSIAEPLGSEVPRAGAPDSAMEWAVHRPESRQLITGIMQNLEAIMVQIRAGDLAVVEVAAGAAAVAVVTSRRRLGRQWSREQ